MVTLTRNQISWIISILENDIHECRRITEELHGHQLEHAVLNNRVERFEGIVEKLNDALNNNHKRIAIK